LRRHHRPPFWGGVDPRLTFRGCPDPGFQQILLQGYAASRDARYRPALDME